MSASAVSGLRRPGLLTQLRMLLMECALAANTKDPEFDLERMVDDGELVVAVWSQWIAAYPEVRQYNVIDNIDYTLTKIIHYRKPGYITSRMRDKWMKEIMEGYVSAKTLQEALGNYPSDTQFRFPEVKTLRDFSVK
jgi:hypothetical protein